MHAITRVQLALVLLVIIYADATIFCEFCS